MTADKQWVCGFANSINRDGLTLSLNADLRADICFEAELVACDCGVEVTPLYSACAYDSIDLLTSE